MKRVAPMIVIMISLSGCFGLTDEQQAETDRLNIKYDGIMKEIKNVYTQVSEGNLTPAEAMAHANRLWEQGKGVKEELDAIQGADAWRKYLSWAANAVLFATTGAAGFKYRDLLVRVVRTVHKVRKGNGGIEDLVGELKALNHKGLNKQAEKLPELNRNIDLSSLTPPPAPKPPEAEAA